MILFTLFERAATVPMTPDEAAEANRTAYPMRLHLRWWPSKERR